MKWPLNKIIHCLAMTIYIACLFMSCSTPISSGGSTETTSANIIGTIRNENGAPLKGAMVRIVPASYNPFNKSGGAGIDSFVTKDNGVYYFKLQTSGFFNLIAQSNTICSYTDSIYVDKNNKTYVPDDTLRAPGSLSGTVKLNPGEDNRQIFILILGTNTFAQPKDSSGDFSFPSLAQGGYNLRILTSFKDYAVFDTSIVIESGKNTTIPELIQLKFDGVPAIEQVTSLYDVKLMQVTLSWPACDTSKISSYYVFRNSDVSKTPLSIIKKTDTVFIDDVMILNADSSKFTTVVDIDTLRYTVAALGKNLTLGKVAIAPEILRRSILTPIDTISYPTTANQFGRNFAFDNANNIYIAGIGSVIKLDQTGKELANYTDTLDSISATMQNTGLNASDVNGDVYVFDTNTFQTRLTRLTSDLKFISKFIATDTDNSHRNASVALSNNGMLCQFGGLNTNTTSLFDSTLSIVRTVTISELITSAQIRNDTIFTLSFAGFKAYDMNFNELESWSVIDEITKYYAINSKPDIRTFKLSQSGIYAFAECFYPTVYFFDSNKNFLGRYALRGSIAGFDGTDRLYCDNGNGSLFRFKINY